MAKNRKPKAAVQPRDKRDPRAEPVNAFKQTPLWSFAIVDTEGPWSLAAIDEKTWVWLLNRLKTLEQMTWDRLRHRGSNGSHNVAKNQLISDAQKRLVELKQDDVDEVFSLVLNGKPRLWGILDGRVLKILWWDPEHKICPSTLKNT